jgi:multidrug efflux pump subunit AcrB
MKSLIAYFIRQKLFGNLLTIFVFVVGLASTLLIRREVFPNINFDILSVSTLFPGSSPEEVEKLVTNPLEQDFQEVDGIKKIRSVSIEGFSEIIIQLDPDQTTDTEAKADVQDVLDQMDLPEGAEDPKVIAIKSKLTPIIEVSLRSTIDPILFRENARDLEKALERLPGVARVSSQGIRKLEIKVDADPQKLARYRISLDEVVQALKNQNLAIPAGTLEAKSDSLVEHEKLVRTVGEFKTEQDVAQTVIRANEFGNPIRVMDVAKVYYGLEKAKVLTRTNGDPSISLTILKKEKADAVTVVETVKKFMSGQTQLLAAKGIQYSFVNDLSEYINRRIGILSGNLVVGLILVFGVLALILRVRIAILVSLGIPFAFLGAMILFYQFDQSLNLISLLGFIIVSGMLVDDAIVVMDAAARRIERGESPEEAALKGTQEIWKAVAASVLTTVVAFLPMLFMSGIFGKFVRQIPIGVILALIASLFEAFFILPQHIASFIRTKDLVHLTGVATKDKPIGERFKDYWDHKVTPGYARFLKIFVIHKWKTLGATFLLFVLSLGVAGGAMKFVLFPPDGIEIFFVRVTAPTSVGLEATQKFMVEEVEKKIKALPPNELKDFVTVVGVQQEDPNDPATKRGGHLGQIAVYLHPEEGRDRSAAEVIAHLKTEIKKPDNITSIVFDRAGGGPPVGKPISVAVRGKTFEEILPAVQALEEQVKKMPGAIDVTNSYAEGKEEVQIIVNGNEAKAAQLSVAQVGTTVRAAFDGLVATSVQSLDDEVDVRVSFPKASRSDLDSLQGILIPNSQGNLVPLPRVSRLKMHRGINAFEHENNEREVKVLGEIDTDQSSATQMSAQIAKLFPELLVRFPNVSFSFGGEDEDTQESLQSLIRAFGIAALGIFFILILTFESIIQPLLVLISIPFGIIGVIWAFFFHGLPLSFMGMLGVVALAGVIVNNAIVFIDAVNQERIEGRTGLDSIVVAASTRLRPIFLTTFTTVCGLMPTAYGIGGVDKFVVPIAMALGWGLVVGSLLTIFVLPAAFAALDVILERVKGQKHNLKA